MNSSRGTDTVPQSAAQLGRAGVAVSIAAASANLLAYLVPLLGARTLGAGDLGAIATMMAILAICSVPGLGLQMAVAVAQAKHGAVHRLDRLTLMAVAVAVLPLLALTPVLAKVLRLPWEAIVLAAVLTAAVVASGGWLGQLQGGMRFARLAVGMALLGVARCGGIIVGLVLGLDLIGLLALGAAVAVLAVAAIRPLVPADVGEPKPVAGLAREVWVAGSATVVLFVLSYADLLAARYLLSDQGSANYAVLNVLTKGAIWAPQVVTVLVLPRLAQGSRRALLFALGLVATSGTILVTASAVAGGLAFRAAGGEDYVGLGRYAPVFAATGALYALVFVLINAQVAAGAKWPSAPLWAGTAGLVVVTVWLVPHTFTAVMWCALGTASLILVATAVPNVARHRRIRVAPPYGTKAAVSD
jgi:O-antigen/teichoic acid export membrane protein